MRSPRPLNVALGRRRCSQRSSSRRSYAACADPEPGDLVIVQKGAVSQRDASRIDRIAIVNLFELKARVAGVLAEQPVRFPGSRWPRARDPVSGVRPSGRLHQTLGSALPLITPAKEPPYEDAE
jgi:hypothetical protein